MKSFHRFIKLGAACAMAAGALVVAGAPAQAAVTRCPPQTRPVIELISISPFQQNEFTGHTLIGETPTHCTYRGTTVITAQGAPSETLFNDRRTFRKSRMSDDGGVTT